MIERIRRHVSSDQWRLSEALGSRQVLLQEPTTTLLADVARQSIDASERISLQWHEADEFSGYFRFAAVIPIDARTFDQLINGCSGYRAQYYLSPEEGVLFNRDLIEALLPSVESAYLRSPVDAPWNLCRMSLLGPHSKVWVFEEKAAFDAAAPDTLNPPRWVESGATRGRRVPLPSHSSIDVKGTFLHPSLLDIRVDDLKLDRPCDLFRRGYT